MVRDTLDRSWGLQTSSGQDRSIQSKFFQRVLRCRSSATSTVCRPLNSILLPSPVFTAPEWLADIIIQHSWAADIPEPGRGLRGPHSPPANREWARDPEIFTEIVIPAPPQSKAPEGPGGLDLVNHGIGPLITTHCGSRRQIRDHSATGDQQLPCFRSPNRCSLNMADPALLLGRGRVHLLSLSPIFGSSLFQDPRVSLFSPLPLNQGNTII